MRAVLTVLGSGTSMGVPTIGCTCKVCTSEDARDHRTRPSVLLEYDGHTVLIDTTPDFRQQALREKMTRLDAILYTHAHADHILGLDDVRPLSFRHATKIPMYADEETAAIIERMFAYIFDPDSDYISRARVEMNRIRGPVDLFGAVFKPVSVMHGKSAITAFRFGAAAYLTDFSAIPEQSMAELRGLDILFLDALRHKPHPTHSTLEDSLKLVEQLKPRRAFFTHMSHDLPHEETNSMLPSHVRLSHDGLKLEFEI
jgi:phosphoribosyl 1,2-cyclic phosphate phosphodiesterase